MDFKKNFMKRNCNFEDLIFAYLDVSWNFKLNEPHMFFTIFDPSPTPAHGDFKKNIMKKNCNFEDLIFRRFMKFRVE